jgi:L-fuculose-phosphate aldolase
MLAAYKNLVWSVVNLVNAPRGRTYHQQRDKLLLKGEQRQQFVAVAHQLVANGLALGPLGELSLRLSARQLAITASHSQLAQLAETDLITCPLEADGPSETAAPHLSWHRLIYRHTPAQAVLLGHPPYAITLANAAQLPEPELMPEMWNIVGHVTLLSPAELSPETLTDAMQHHHVVLIPHTGVLIRGDSLANLFARAQAVEYLSRLTALARHMG